MTSDWLQALAGGGLGLLASLCLMKFVGPRGWMDLPDHGRKKHGCPIPRTGGMTLWLILVGTQLTGAFSSSMHPLDWAALHLMALTGMLDDRLNLRARYKALAGLAVAIVLAAHVALTMDQSLGPLPFLGMMLSVHPVVSFPLLMLWFWAMPQAFNLIDGVNGLSLGLSMLLLGVLGSNIGFHSPFLWGGLLAVTALNFPKAKHFLGDCGALMLGTLFAILGVHAFALTDPNMLFWVFAYPIVDVSLVVGIRRWKEQPLSAADRSHLHHWMLDHVGGHPWLATPILLGLAFLPMVRATNLPGHHVISTLGALALVVLAFKAFRDRVKDPKHPKMYAQVRRKIPHMVSQVLPDPTPSGSFPRH